MFRDFLTEENRLYNKDALPTLFEFFPMYWQPNFPSTVTFFPDRYTFVTAISDYFFAFFKRLVFGNAKN